MLLLRLSWEDWNCKSDWQLDVVLRCVTWDDVRLLSFDHLFDSLESLWRVKEDLSQREMVWEFVDVFRNGKLHSFWTLLDVSDLQNLLIVANYIWCHLERRHIDDIDVRVLWGKNSADLSIFSLKEFVHRDSLGFFDWQRVDVDFDPFSGLDCRPFLPEFFHHFFPDKQWLLSQFIDSILRLFLELKESERALNRCSFAHQEFEVGVCNFGLVSPPVFLNDRCSQYWTLLSFEHKWWNFDPRSHLVLVCDAVVELFFGRLFVQIQIWSGKHTDFLTLNVSNFDVRFR